VDKVIYTAMTAAKELQLRQAVNANNISNMSSSGFKKEIVATRALHSTGAGTSLRVHALTHVAGIDSTEGQIKMTGQANDLTVRGEQWFVLKDVDGEYLSKNISISLNEFGEMINVDGSHIQTSQGGVLVPTSAEIEVTEQGVVNLMFPQQPQLIEIADIKVVDTAGLVVRKNNKGQVVSPQAQLSRNIQLIAGAQQSSNVNTASAAMETMQLSKQFGMNMKIYDAAQKMGSATNKLLGN
jgi:flagellar basal-body rod protein FlgF